jgi:hypothetical protein
MHELVHDMMTSISPFLVSVLKTPDMALSLDLPVLPSFLQALLTIRQLVP